MNVDEPISICEYQASWPACFSEEAAAIRGIPGIVNVEHFGSTAVSGLPSKPIIDILVGVDVWPIDEMLIGEFEKKLQYQFCGEAEIAGRFYFRKRGERNFNLAVVKWNGPLWNENLLVRDYLRVHPTEAADYAAHKLRAIDQGNRTLLAYSQYKNEFMANLLARARVWATPQQSAGGEG